MKVLIACEMSGVVREAFRKRGHDAWSCDLVTPLDNSPYHYTDDVINHLNEGWDLMIGHPPCTYLCNTGVRWLCQNEERQALLEQARKFFYALWDAPIERICLENPTPHKHGRLPPYQQHIQPWYFGHSVNKRTCLWLKNLPKLVPTKVVDKEEVITFPSGKTMGKWYYETSCLPHKDRATARSITFQGIADAMALQWG